MIYLERLEIPDQDAETDVILAERRTCFNGVYPFRVFPQKQITQFDSIVNLWFPPIRLCF